MEQLEKIRVAVLYGGRSAEHEVSLRSAANVIQHLDADKFDAIPIGIDKNGNWFLGKDILANSLEKNHVSMQDCLVNTWFTAEWVGKPVKMQDAHDILPTQTTNKAFDVVFPVVHGTFCEDGTLQGLLELANLPYVGCGVLASAVGMDKDVSKRLASHAGINIAPYLAFNTRQWQADKQNCLKKIDAELNYPLFVKPANTGSSVGISKIKNKSDLQKAIEEAFQYDTKILVEEGLDIIELEVAVLEALEAGKEPLVSIVGEITPDTKHGFYSYEAKYLDENGAELVVPARIDDVVKEKTRAIARKLFQVLECEGMARIDLFYDKKSGEIYFNEINTIPGFTQISMYPRLMEASGISYKDLLSHLIQLALNRFQTKSHLTCQRALDMVSAATA